jgi:hypothetical protein
VPLYGAWPERQRFDYFVRAREASPDEVAAMLAGAEQQPSPSYPQREAVLLALRKLTGLDAGDSAADWRKALAVAILDDKPKASE